MFLRSCLSERKFSRESWLKEPMARYEMKADLKSQLKGKTKKEVIEMIGDSTTTNYRGWSNEWRFIMGTDGSDTYDCLFMIIFFEGDEVKKVTFEGT